MTLVTYAPYNVFFINFKSQTLIGLERRIIIRFHVENYLLSSLFYHAAQSHLQQRAAQFLPALVLAHTHHVDLAKSWGFLRMPLGPVEAG